MRLIDADALIEEMNKYVRQNFTLDDDFEHWLKGMESALEIIEEQPTAYDVDAVVEQLEEWKDIANYEGIYQISNMGNVRSLDRIVHPNNQYLQKGKILKPLDNGKYLFVTLRKDGVKENKYIHRLVAEHFLLNPLFYNEVNHKDEDKHNNCISNLEWCTHSYNMNYGTRNEKISKTKKAGGSNG